MFIVRHGNAFNGTSEAIIHLEGARDLYGSDISQQFAARFPASVVAFYRARVTGKLGSNGILFSRESRPAAPRFIVHFAHDPATADHLDVLASRLEALVAMIQKRKVASVAVPVPGGEYCGLGRGNWIGLLRTAFRAASNVSVDAYSDEHPQEETNPARTATTLAE